MASIIWDNKAIVQKAAEEILSIHERYDKFAHYAVEEVAEYLEELL